MEGVPFIPEAPEVDSGKSPEKKDKKKSRQGKELGLFAVESPEKAEKKQPDTKPERSLFDVDDRKQEEEPDNVIQFPKRPKAETIEVEEGPQAKVFRLRSEAEPVAEEEAPTDEVAETETEVIVPALAEQRSEELEAEGSEEAPDLAAQQLMEAISEGQDPDEALAETAAEIGASEAEIAELVAETDVLPEAEAEELLDEDEEEPEIKTAETEPEGPHEFGETDEEIVLRAEEEETDDATAAAGATGTGTGTPPPTGGATPPPAGGPAGTAGGGPGGGAPPHGGGPFGGGPGGPHGPFGPFGPGGPAGPGGPGGVNPNVAPPPRRSPFDVPEGVERYDRGNPAAAALVGGIIGYLIGRRRGRKLERREWKKAEKKLTKQVENMQWQLRAKEDKIRKIAAEQTQKRGLVVVEALAAKQAAKKAEAPKVVKTAEQVNREIEVRAKAPEARQFHVQQQAPERIGHVLMAAETPVVVRSEKFRPETAASPKEEMEKLSQELSAGHLSERRVETLNRAELLSLSEKIVVDGSSLRQIYETHLVSEKGLRRLIAEHLRSGDLKKALRREIVEREIDFERDPALRDMAPTGVSGGAAASGNKEQLNKLLERATVGLPADSEEAAYYRARAAFDAHQHDQQQRQKHLIEVTFTTVILILLGVVIILFMTRG